MSRSYRIWYLLALFLVLVPPGVRLLWWQRSTSAAVDPVMARAGEVLFNHEWTANDPLSPNGDGLGPVFNANSCVACHNQAAPGGGGGLETNVTTFTSRIPGQKPRQGVVHAFGGETLHDIHPDLPNVSQPTLAQVVTLNAPGHSDKCIPVPRGVHLSQRNTPALFGVKLIDEIPERDILAGAKNQKLKWGMAPSVDEDLPVGRALHLPDGRIRRFGWKGQMASLSDFVQAACANELGLGNPGQPQPTPIYATGQSVSRSSGLDLTTEQCDQLTAFCASLERPVERLPNDVSQDQAASGKWIFSRIGCADCHSPKLGKVDGLYSDLLLHQMGQELVGGGSYGEPPIPDSDGDPDDSPSPGEWRTPPLWGVADSAPYLHDGRAATLQEAIQLHAGQGKRSARLFATLRRDEQAQLIGFLRTLRAPQ